MNRRLVFDWVSPSGTSLYVPVRSSNPPVHKDLFSFWVKRPDIFTTLRVQSALCFENDFVPRITIYWQYSTVVELPAYRHHRHKFNKG